MSTSIMSTSIMSPTLYYPETLGNGCLYFESHSLLSPFSLLYHKFLSLMQTTQEVNPHPRIVPCVNMWSATFLFLFFFYFVCHLFNVDACICHIAREGQVEWTTPHHTTPLKCCTLCYSKVLHATLIL
jgi:hypothetical protein